jgi:hypothetical protein
MQNVTTPVMVNQTDSVHGVATNVVTGDENTTNSVLENVTNSTFQTLKYFTNSTLSDIKDTVEGTIVPSTVSFLREPTAKLDHTTSEELPTKELSAYDASRNSTLSSLKDFANTTLSSFVNATNSTISTVENVVSATTQSSIAKPAVYDVISEADDQNALNQNITATLNDNWTITEVGPHPENGRGSTDPYNSDPSQLLYIFAVLGAYVIIICVLVIIQMRRRNRYETLDDEYYDEYLMRKQMLTERRTLLKMNIKRIRGVKDGYLLDKILPNQEV